jgi:hypothetical protein
MSTLGANRGRTTVTAGRCPFTVSIGALLIGALVTSDRNELLAHLRCCDRCRDEMVLLAPLPGLLRRTLPLLEPGLR